MNQSNRLKHLTRLAVLLVSAVYIYSCSGSNPIGSSANSSSTSSSGGSSGGVVTGGGGSTGPVPTATPCLSVSIMVINTTAFTVDLYFDGGIHMRVATGGSATYSTCNGVHDVVMAGIGGTGPGAYSMNYSPTFPICGRAFGCKTSSLVAGSYFITVTQGPSPMACAGEISWACP